MWRKSTRTVRLANEVHLRWRQTRESNPNAAPQPITTACLLKQKELESDSLTLSAEKQSSLFSAGSHLSSLASQTSHTLLSPLSSHFYKQISQQTLGAETTTILQTIPYLIQWIPNYAQPETFTRGSIRLWGNPYKYQFAPRIIGTNNNGFIRIG